MTRTDEETLERLVREPRSRRLAAALGARAELHVVGGTVRNALMGRPPGDLDLATALLPEEVAAAAPVLVGLRSDEPDVGLVDQRRWLEGLPRLLVRQVCGGELAEFVVDEREQFGRGPGVARLDGIQELSDVGHGAQHTPARSEPPPETGPGPSCTLCFFSPVVESPVVCGTMGQTTRPARRPSAGREEEWVVRDWRDDMTSWFATSDTALREVVDLDLEESFVETLRAAREAGGRAA